MFIAPHEWLDPAQQLSPFRSKVQTPTGSFDRAALYKQLACSHPTVVARGQGAEFLQTQLEKAQGESCDVPEVPQDLSLWLASSYQTVHGQYAQYLQQRKAGLPRRYFSNRAHALYFLRSVAPTKLVDGAWLYGVLEHWRNPRFSNLVRTYVEELGEGAPDKNHVLVYRRLLARYGLEPLHDLADSAYHQGLIQLALGLNAERFLPEIVGFNLAYEQLPLHLLITAYELNELGLDPYYFTLHVTVDNGDTGHAQRACQAVLDTLPRLEDGGAFWSRVREGSKLANTGIGTLEVINGFDIDAEVRRILMRKSTAGSGAHSDYCRVAGRSVNDWLSAADGVPSFLSALENAGWIRRGEPAVNSRFWQLLQGDRAEMFGVFSSYELQVIHDWILGADSINGQPYLSAAVDEGSQPVRSFRVSQRLARGAHPLKFSETDSNSDSDEDVLDSDLALLKRKLRDPNGDYKLLLLEAMSPANHWTPAGLYATRLFNEA